MRQTTVAILTLTVLGIIAQDLFAQQWGTITGRFVVKGAAVLPPPLAIPPAMAGACAGPLANPQLRIGQKDELEDVAVWLYLDRGEEAPQPHPRYAALRKLAVQIANKGCLYEPQVAMVQPGQTLQFVNADPMMHNYKVEGFANPGINFLVQPNAMRAHVFQAEERYPMHASCGIHPWMKAKIIIRESPYMAVSDDKGKFTIENLPVGTHKFQIWHSLPGTIKEVTLGGTVLKDRKGIVEVDVKPGLNDLGNMVIDAGLLK